jgi:trans-aconitate methyltransferase
MKDVAEPSVISIGCGTGLSEVYMMEELGLKNIDCFDVSPSMVRVARGKGLQAREGNVLEPLGKKATVLYVLAQVHANGPRSHDLA